jgi:hypothetical protein
MANTTEREFTATIVSLLNGAGALTGEELCDLADVQLDGTDSLRGMEAVNFRDEGMMTSNAGLTVRLPNGRSYQLTVVRSG